MVAVGRPTRGWAGVIAVVVVAVAAAAALGAATLGRTAHAGTGTYAPPYQAGPRGGDQYNVIVVQPKTGRVAVARAYPYPGAFNCAGAGGYADLDLRITPSAPVSTVDVHVTQMAIDPYTWITVLVRDGSGSWLGGRQVRGPLAGTTDVRVALPSPAPAGAPLTVQFGLQVASACPNADGGTALFSSVSLLNSAAAATRATSAGPALRARGDAAAGAVAFDFVPGDDDLPGALRARMVAGQTLVFANADPLGAHTLTAVATTASGIPLFDSGAPVGDGQFTTVRGTGALAPGSYLFYCRVHTQMRGVLQVIG